MDQLSQTQIQNYTLIHKIGEGASSQVILAKRNTLKTLSAIKMIPKTPAFSSYQLQSILQERQILSTISHPFIVKMDQAFQTRNHFCLVLEYCPGGDLYNHLHSSQPFNQKKINLYAAQLVLALQYLHSQNIVFRDLKPENILIGKDGYLKLTDFGLSSFLGAQKLGNPNSDICGTFQYTCPQFFETKQSGKASDWWTLGCCLYELLYQVSPFYSDDKKTMKQKIMLEDPVFSGKTCSTLRDFVRKLLTKDPKLRMEFIQTIKTHKVFSEINLQKLLLKQYPMPYVPEYQRGKKMVKVIKEEVSVFTKISEEETPQETYLYEFDFNYQGLEQKTVSSSEEESDQKDEKSSTQDDQDQNYKSFFDKEKNECQKMTQTL